ncbi:O-antigen ligase family protein [Sedimentibacter sp. zth1]|uniref:O-antigen ligase family protein n=1 Tax=Sedimentibacter sp. zth1 TaxID=2816908 RepID=UPI001A927FA0|nr:O-antigen ligase family protein [Sedimentibacter sp. zth1]QSX05290.1 O-antigen ligase family protein [Sedimentibacter sp. zth1]
MKTVKNKFSNKKLSPMYYIPLLLIAGFVPLLVHGKYIDLQGTVQSLYWTGQNQVLDFFSYWKSRWVIVLTSLALFTYICLVISKKLPFKKQYKYYIPMGIYALFVIISTIFAIDASTALNGFVDMYQGMWVLLSYVAITFLMINFINNERDTKMFLNAFVFLIIVEGIIGVGQYFGLDIFNTKFGNHLIVPSGVTVDGGLTFNFGKHTIYGTLFNTNYVGSFATLMMPMAAVFLLSARTLKTKIIGVVAFVLCTFTWIGCNSRAGYVGVVFATIVAIIMFRKYVVKYWKISVNVLLVAVICLVGLNAVSGGRIINKVKTLNIFKEIDRVKIEANKDDKFIINSIDIEGNIVKVKSSHQDLNIKIEGDSLLFIDEEGNKLPMKTTKTGKLIVGLPKQHYIQVEMTKNYPGFTLSTKWGSKGSISFYISGETIQPISNTGRLVEIKDVEYFKQLEGLEKFASGRGYIWSRTIPLLKKHVFTGAGADNFAIAFPQDDYIAKMNMSMDAAMVVDKPHNMYLQMAINTGVVSLIAFLTVCIIYIVSSIKALWRVNYDTLEKKMCLACFLGVIGYLFAGIFNDQIVSVAPLFFVILGLGISINIRLNRKGKENV